MELVLRQDMIEDMAPDDENLIVRIAARDEAAFRLFAARYAALVFALAFRMCSSRAAAEDIVQETWLRVWQHAGKWDRARGASVKTWLCRIASNLCIDQARRRRRETGDEIPDVIDGNADAGRSLETRQTGALVARALQALPARQRAALVMFHYEDLSVAEIAAALETTAKGAEGLLGRARQGLRRSLTKHEGDLR